MLRFTHRTDDPDETAAWGEALARTLRPGDLIRLNGPLGAGKTTLVRSIAHGLGADTRLVSSPTFVLMNEYPLHSGGTLVHVDAYRLGGDDLESLGWDRLGKDAIVIVEWAERIEDALPETGARISIDVVDESSREFEVSLPEAWRERPGLERLDENVIRCPETDRIVAPGDPFYPFATERARLADLHAWMSESYRVDRPIDPDDDLDSLADPGGSS